MTTDSLKADIKANMAELDAMIETLKTTADAPSTPTADALIYLKNTMWPFLEGLVDAIADHEEAIDESQDVLEELGEAVDDLTENRGSVLMPNEAGVFALVVQLARAIADTVSRGATPTPDQITGLRMACDAAEKTLESVTINVDLDSEDDQEGDDDDDDDE